EAVMKMDDMTQQNTALVEEAAAAAESMMEQADELMNAVSVFQLEGEVTRSNDRRVTHNAMRPIASKLIAAKAPSSAALKPAAARPAKVSVVKSGTDDGDWEEF
ncbi:MAG: chemotaxis protein, partial [Methylotenera sp.]|nr:chemotaxis protein [Methylotenera sp.]